MGVEALQLRYDSSLKAYEARQESRKAGKSRHAGPIQAVGRQRDLLQLQRRDPTVLKYKSALHVNAYKQILKWTRDDDEDAGAVFAVVAN